MNVSQAGRILVVIASTSGPVPDVGRTVRGIICRWQFRGATTERALNLGVEAVGEGPMEGESPIDGSFFAFWRGSVGYRACGSRPVQACVPVRIGDPERSAGFTRRCPVAAP